jgi:hypothetical protein
MPYLDVFHRSNNATELHDTPQKSRPRLDQAIELRTICDSRFAKSAQNAYLGACLSRNRRPQAFDHVKESSS